MEMTAYEFQATVNDGIIHIPAEYRNKISDNVKVILLSETPKYLNPEVENIKKKSDLLLSPTIDTKGWKWNREEANER